MVRKKHSSGPTTGPIAVGNGDQVLGPATRLVSSVAALRASSMSSTWAPPAQEPAGTNGRRASFQDQRVTGAASTAGVFLESALLEQNQDVPVRRIL